jgi:hypothetical protein
MATLPMLTVCCVCKHVAQGESSRWMPMSAFLERHQLRPSDVRLSHTYCPVCYERQAEAWALAPKVVSKPTTPRAA